MLALAVAGLTLSACDDKAGTKSAVADAKTATEKADDAKAADKADDAKAADKADEAADKADEPADEAAADAADEPADEAAGEGGGGADVLAGTWTLDPAGMKDMDEYKNAPDDQKKMMDSMLETMKMEMTFEGGSLKLHAEIGGETKDTEGKYSVKSSEGPKVVIESDVDGKKEELTVTVEDGKLTMEQGGQKMVFNKKG